MPPILITILGVPIPQGSKSLFRGRMVDANPKLKRWRKTVTLEATRAYAGRMPLEGPVCVCATFSLPRPATVPPKRRPWPCVKPDVDKLLRALLDGLTDAGIWGDDGQVVRVVACKVYARTPMEAGCSVEISQHA